MALSRSQAQRTPLKRMLVSICALAQGRFELIGIELAEARARLLTFIFISFAAILLGTMALVTLTVLIAVVFWQTYRWQALAALMMAYLCAMMFCVLKLRAQARKAPPLFETTKAEFKKDREILSESYQAFVDE